MKIGFIGDIVGRPGREMIKKHLISIKEKYKIDIIIANGENASHGFGLNLKNANELFSNEIDLITGGNHSWDRKEIISSMDTLPILRPLNYPQLAPGKGIGYVEKNSYKLCVINLMGYYSMPMVDNPFTKIKEELEKIEKNDGVFIDFHAEATSEKRCLFALLKDKVSAIAGTHTHIGTDDLSIEDGCGYVTDVGLTGCRNNIIGVDIEGPMKRFLTGMHHSFDISNNCKKIFHMVVFDIEKKRCIDAYKLKIYEGCDEIFEQRAWHEK